MSDILTKRGKAFLLGNEAVVRGALEAGVSVVTTYPGTPASEIGDSFSKIAKEMGIYFEYSTNEKVAFEVAAGSALFGSRSLVAFKNYGLNVALDSIVTFPYLNRGGLVIVVVDDVGCSSSVQAEEDTRFFAKIAHLPLIEPSNAQEAKEMTKYAFKLSEKFSTPVILRLTTNVSHTAEIVKLEKIKKSKKLTKKEINEIVNKIKTNKIISYSDQHKKLHEKIEKLKEISEKSELNFVINLTKNKENELAIIASGVSYNYALEAMTSLNLKIPLLKIGFSWPLPEEKIRKFIQDSKAKQILVLEELEDFLEKEVERLSNNLSNKLNLKANSKSKINLNFQPRVYGKELLSYSAYRPEDVLNVIAKLMLSEKTGNEKISNLLKNEKIKNEKIKKILEKIPKRNPTLCPGCPHRASYWAVKKALIELGENWRDKIYSGDIGCYLLGTNKPIEMQDFFVSMGSSIGISEGIDKAINEKTINKELKKEKDEEKLKNEKKEKVVTFIGESTFLHAGIPALINAVYNKNNLLVLILDNGATAMTGHQPNPTVGITGMYEPTKAIVLEDVVKGCGVTNVKVVNAFNINEFVETFKKLYNQEGVSVIIARGRCRLLTVRELSRKGIKVPKAEVFDDKEAANCFELLKEFNCAAIRKAPKKKKIYIDQNLCWGCGVCLQLCKGIRFKK